MLSAVEHAISNLGAAVFRAARSGSLLRVIVYVTWEPCPFGREAMLNQVGTI